MTCNWHDALDTIRDELSTALAHLVDLHQALGKIEAAGMYPALPTEQWQARGDSGEARYLYMLFRKNAEGTYQGPGGKRKLYVGADPGRQAEARRLAENRRRWRAIGPGAAGPRPLAISAPGRDGQPSPPVQAVAAGRVIGAGWPLDDGPRRPQMTEPGFGAPAGLATDNGGPNVGAWGRPPGGQKKPQAGQCLGPRERRSASGQGPKTTGDRRGVATVNDNAGLFLWVDPRREPGYNPRTHDLAAFMERAAALFQAKDQ